MTQIHILHALNAKAIEQAEAFTSGFIEEGYVVYWDRKHGGMSVLGSEAAAHSACVVVLWTVGARYSKWVLDDAEAARERGRLVEVLIEPVSSPWPNSAPLDFIDWNKRAEGPLWKSLMERVKATVGRPLGRLPAKEVGEVTVAPVLGAGAVMLSIMAGVTPQTNSPGLGLGVSVTQDYALSETTAERGGYSYRAGATPNFSDARPIEEPGALVAPAPVVTLRFEPLSDREASAPLAEVQMFDMLEMDVAGGADAGVSPGELIQPGSAPLIGS